MANLWLKAIGIWDASSGATNTRKKKLELKSSDGVFCATTSFYDMGNHDRPLLFMRKLKDLGFDKLITMVTMGETHNTIGSIRLVTGETAEAKPRVIEFHVWVNLAEVILSLYMNDLFYSR